MTTIIDRLYAPNLSTSYPRPLFLVPVSAGFPSPADDYLEDKLDLNGYPRKAGQLGVDRVL